MAIDFGASLDKLLGAYTQVSQVRAQVDLAKYNAVADKQNATLHAPQAMNPREAYSSGNAINPAMMQTAGMGAGGWARRRATARACRTTRWSLGRSRGS